MPKEMVIDKSAFNEDATRGLRVEVFWAKQDGLGNIGYIQLATVADKLPAAELESPGGANGWYASLDRESCNSLIKYLRRARDQAFGRDE